MNSIIVDSQVSAPLSRRLADAVRGLLGERCAACGTGRSPGGFCADCRAHLPRLPEAVCPTCAIASAGNAVCGSCLRRPPAFHATVAGALFDYPLDAMVKAMKYAGRIELARALASVLAERVQSLPLPDLVVPVALSVERQRDRGFNQALEIARALPAPLAARVDASALSRTRDAPPQAALTLEERRRNVKDAFTTSRRLEGLRIAVVDDVMTTGMTMDAAARALVRAGASRVEAWVVLRTPSPR
ncbi:MAG: ComF family protein [Betaproteobacteria bacterium]|nr:ComF family protein [Betaproteobacteria bacterium]